MPDLTRFDDHPMEDLVDQQAGEWHFRAYRRRDPGAGFIGYAKRGPFLTKSVSIYEPGQIHFDFAPTADEVMAKLKAEVLH
jgi:hypothetical protein